MDANQTSAENGGGAFTASQEFLLREQVTAQFGGRLEGRSLAPVNFLGNAADLARAGIGAFANPPQPQPQPAPLVHPPAPPSEQQPPPMAPPSPSRSGVDHPAVRLQYDLAKLIFSRAGVPQQNDAFSWASFIRPFKETPYPADDNVASLLAERLSREAGAFVSSFKLLRSFSSGKASGKGRARTDSVATFGTAAAAQGSDEMGDGGRAASPTPSNASVRTTASSGNKRRRAEQAVEEAAATAAVHAQGQFMIEESWSREVKCFLPELGAAVLAGRALLESAGQTLGAAFICDGDDPLSMDAESFSSLPPAFDTRDLSVMEQTPTPALEHIRQLQASIAALHGVTVAARASLKRCFDLYRLACMTKGANRELAHRSAAPVPGEVGQTPSVNSCQWCRGRTRLGPNSLPASKRTQCH